MFFIGRHSRASAFLFGAVVHSCAVARHWVALGALVCAFPSHAQSELHLDLPSVTEQAPAACQHPLPTFLEQLTARLGYAPRVEPGSPLLRASWKERDDGTVALTLEWWSDRQLQSQRELQGTLAGCHDLIKAASVIAAAHARSLPMTRLQPAEPATEPAVVAPPLPAPLAETAPPRATAPTWRIGVGPSGIWGSTPGIALGADVEVSARWSAFHAALEFQGAASLPRVAGGVPLRAELWSGAAVACWVPGLWEVCGAMAAGAVRVWTPSVDVVGVRSASAPRWLLGPRVGVTLPTHRREGRWSFGVFVEAAYALFRPTFRISDAPVWSGSGVVVRLGLRAQFSLGGPVR